MTEGTGRTGVHQSATTKSACVFLGGRIRFSCWRQVLVMKSSTLSPKDMPFGP